MCGTCTPTERHALARVSSGVEDVSTTLGHEASGRPCSRCVTMQVSRRDTIAGPESSMWARNDPCVRAWHSQPASCNSGQGTDAQPSDQLGRDPFGIDHGLIGCHIKMQVALVDTPEDTPVRPERRTYPPRRCGNGPRGGHHHRRLAPIRAHRGTQCRGTRDCHESSAIRRYRAANCQPARDRL
jgi:hypothetical protein